MSAGQDEAMVVGTLAFMVVRQILTLVGLGPSPDAKDVEIAVLHHQLMVLRRHVARPRYTPADRALLAALAKLLPRNRWPIFLVTPSTLLCWHRELIRRADTLADWLRRHPGVEVVCRDGAGAYTDEVRSGALQAVQVADRWRLWNNLARYVEKTVAQHHRCLKDPSEPQPQATPAARDVEDLAAEAPAAWVDSSVLVRRTRQRWEAVHALRAQGKGISVQHAPTSYRHPHPRRWTASRGSPS